MHHRPNTNYPAIAPATNSRSNLRTGLIEGLFSTPFTVVSIPGGFLLAALLTQWFGIDKSAFGWIVSLPSWANALQVLALPALARLVTSKDLALGMGWLNVGLWAMLVASLPFLPKNDPAATAMFFGVFFALASASGAFHTVGWTVWIREWVPRRLRGAYLGKRNSLISAATLGFLLLSVAWLEAQKSSLVPYLGILAVMVACRAFSLLWQHGIRTRHDNSPLAAPPLHHSLAECRATPGLVPFILFSAWMNFWMAFTGPFTAVFAFEELHLDPGAFAFLTAIGTVSGVLGWTYWGRVTDLAGAIPVIAIGSALWEISNILWAVLVPGNSWLLYPMFLWGGFFAVSFFMGSFNLLLNLVPSKAALPPWASNSPSPPPPWRSPPSSPASSWKHSSPGKAAASASTTSASPSNRLASSPDSSSSSPSPNPAAPPAKPSPAPSAPSAKPCSSKASNSSPTSPPSETSPAKKNNPATFLADRPKSLRFPPTRSA